MFNTFATELMFMGTVVITEIDEIKEFTGNKYLTFKCQTTRRRIKNKKELVFDHDYPTLVLWAEGAEFAEKNFSVGDLLFVRGEIRGKEPNINLRVKSFEILTPSNEFLECLKDE